VARRVIGARDISDTSPGRDSIGADRAVRRKSGDTPGRQRVKGSHDTGPTAAACAERTTSRRSNGLRYKRLLQPSHALRALLQLHARLPQLLASILQRRLRVPTTGGLLPHSAAQLAYTMHQRRGETQQRIRLRSVGGILWRARVRRGLLQLP